jgi:hypothetical protein
VFYTAGRVLVGTATPVADETMTITGGTPTVLGVSAADSKAVAIAATAATSTSTAIETSGHVRINGTPGVTGLIFADGSVQTTASSGAGGGGPTGQFAGTVVGTAQLNVTSSVVTFTLIPGLTQTIDVPADSVLIILSDGGIQTTSATSGGASVVDLALYIDGAQHAGGGYRRVTAANNTGITSGMTATWSLSVATVLSAGQHTIELRARYILGSTAIVSGNTTPLQGALTVAAIKQ